MSPNHFVHHTFFTVDLHSINADCLNSLGWSSTAYRKKGAVRLICCDSTTNEKVFYYVYHTSSSYMYMQGWLYGMGVSIYSLVPRRSFKA